MTLEVGEIRSRAEQFEGRLREERLQVRAGLKSRPSLTELYDDHRLLAGGELLAPVERALAGAEGSRVRRLRRLLEWVADHQVQRATAPVVEEYLSWESSATVEVGGREIPFRKLLRVIGREPDPSRRAELAELREEQLREAVPRQLDLVEREREAVADLGYGDCLEARQRLCRRNYDGLAEEGRRVVERTEGAYREYRDRYLSAAAVAGEAPTRADELAMRTGAALGEEYRRPCLQEVRSLLERDLAALDLPLGAGGRIRVDAEDRPLKRAESYCIAPRVPDGVVAVVAGFGGPADASDFLAVAGEGLSLAQVDPDLPFEDRMLGDPSVRQAYGSLFSGLASAEGWLERAGAPGEPGDGGGEARRRFGAWLDLLDFRRDVALLEFEMELWRSPRPAALADEYVRRVRDVTGFRPSPLEFLEGVEVGLSAACRLQGRLLAGLLRRELRTRFGADWFRNPGAGPYLTDLFAGRAPEAAELASELGDGPPGGDALLGWYDDRLGLRAGASP